MDNREAESTLNRLIESRDVQKDFDNWANLQDACKWAIKEIHRFRRIKLKVQCTKNSETKTCPYCKLEKTRSEFNKCSKSPSGLQSHCKECQADYRISRQGKKDRRASRLKKLYNMTLEQYDKMLESQGNRCAICGSTDYGRKNDTYFSIDHDHETGQIRGLLCAKCNRALGFFKDNLIFVENAARYLRESKRRLDK